MSIFTSTLSRVGGGVIEYLFKILTKNHYENDF